jgi:hypothetical protein
LHTSNRFEHGTGSAGAGSAPEGGAAYASDRCVVYRRDTSRSLVTSRRRRAAHRTCACRVGSVARTCRRLRQGRPLGRPPHRYHTRPLVRSTMPQRSRVALPLAHHRRAKADQEVPRQRTTSEDSRPPAVTTPHHPINSARATTHNNACEQSYPTTSRVVEERRTPRSRHIQRELGRAGGSAEPCARPEASACLLSALNWVRDSNHWNGKMLRREDSPKWHSPRRKLQDCEIQLPINHSEAGLRRMVRGPVAAALAALCVVAGAVGNSWPRFVPTFTGSVTVDFPASDPGVFGVCVCVCASRVVDSAGVVGDASLCGGVCSRDRRCERRSSPRNRRRW